MSRSVNKAILIGRLGSDPEVRYTQAGTAVANFPVATSEKYTDKSGQAQEKTEWHKIVVWDKLAEIVQQYFRKGMMVYIEGKIQTRQWEDRDGVKRYTTEIVARDLQNLSSKEEFQNVGASQTTYQAAPPNQNMNPNQNGTSSSQNPNLLNQSGPQNPNTQNPNPQNPPNPQVNAPNTGVPFDDDVPF